MKIVTHADAAAFLDAARLFLEAREAEQNLAYGLALGHAAQTKPVDSWWATAHDEHGAVVAAALQTDPHRHLVLTHQTAPGAAAALCLAWRLEKRGGPGLTGPRETTTEAAEACQAQQGVALTCTREMRVHILATSPPRTKAPGEAHLATEAEIPLIADWLRGFAHDCRLPRDAEVADGVAGHLVAGGGVLLWRVDGKPVAMAAASRQTPRSATLSGVYTPPPQRNRGYGSAVTAALADRFLRHGKQFVTLYTDLANPTSNAIYARLGFRPLADFREWAWEADPAPGVSPHG